MFRKLLYPNLYVGSVHHIDIDSLAVMGIRGLLFDLDNTVVPRDVDDFSAEIKDWFGRLEARGFKMCFVSNNGPRRLQNLTGALGLPFVCRAVKPRKKPFLKAMETIGTSQKETAVIGDQIFTDILGGNRLGLFTILVTPMPGKEYWATELINRRLERFIIKRLKRNPPAGCGEV
ncbi:hydrolase [Desulfocucumis palustris]|uniref:Hydrolase n=1 Tax=Desulfocucumis palustris TaxID=1898651 RepID=A0A2L2XD93_9FIRM|nr:YqeG family HAD IIIA-type phosphatase [Desulfocucumis palustris]GBF34208.1 hydrolase [Desulfocucumis palustris]